MQEIALPVKRGMTAAGCVCG